MANSVPSNLALSVINTNDPVASAPHRNNYAAIQAAVNDLEACLSGGTLGQVLEAVDGSDVQWTVPSGAVLAQGQKTSTVSTTGSTFSGGTDLLASALTFTSDGTSTYLVEAYAPFWSNATSNNTSELHMNLNGVDAGIFAQIQGVTGVVLAAIGVIGTPPSGSNTINARLVSPSGTNASVGAGNGGSGVRSAILVRVTKA